MTDKKISELNALTAADDADLYAVVDTSATETKQITHLDHHAGVDLVDDTAGTFASRLITPASTTDWLTINMGDTSYDTGTKNAQLIMFLSAGFPGIFFGTWVEGDGGNAAFIQLDHTSGGPTPGVITIRGDSSVSIQTDLNTVTLDGNGQVIITGLPTSDPGVAGAVYSDGVPSAGVPKVLKISGG